MAPARPMLGDIELQHVQKIEVDGDQVLVQHGVPALEGDFFQGLGRRATQISLTGVLTGPEAGEGLNTLRDKFRATEPVSFVADITTATRVDQVLIEEMGVRELAGKPERFEYAFTLREYIPAPEPERPQPPPPPPPLPSVDTGTLIVEVIVEGQPGFDFSTITVTVEGTQEDDTSLSRTLTNRTENTWTEDEFPPGNYTVRAVVNPQPLSGLASATVQAGQTIQARVTLRPTSNIAKTFIVHFRFDKAFVEPCMRLVLRQVAQYTLDHRDEKLVILGHTDKAGHPDYNQSLSERRARSVFAYLTFGVDDNTRRDALIEWNALRETRPRGQWTTIKDSWGTHEYQHMLQDLGFYPGRVDGKHGPLTRDAVQAFRCHKGLPRGTDVDADVWQALIKDYLKQDELAVPASQFFPKCSKEILKWLGCGEEDPLDRRGTAFRPSRRVELMFVRTDRLPCKVPQPATFNLPKKGAVNSDWCVGSGTSGARCCIVSPILKPGKNKPQPCPTDPAGPWCRQSVEPDTITVEGSIKRELSDGSFEPVPNQAFVLITPKGEVKAGEGSRGKPKPIRTVRSGENRGTFRFDNMPIGFYTLEVITPPSRPVLVRLREQTDRDIKGNAVCKALRPDRNHPNRPVRLDVVIVNAPVLREIRLPVVAHLMTALHPLTRAARTCQDPLDPARRVPQATAHTDAEILAFFDSANRIWRQARIRFDLDPSNIVHVAYAFRTDCEVDEAEFTILLQRCSHPDAVNVFFVGDLAGLGEAGFGVSPEGGAALGVAGCAVGDRFQYTILGILHNVRLNEKQTAQVLAHELGHYLNLDHAADTPANADHLMLPGTLAGTNRTLMPDEVNSARTSQGATDDCVPLSLKVSGATQVGGTLSHQYIFVQHPELIDPFDITIDAEIPDHLLTRGTLTMTGGNPGANSLQRTVSKSTAGEFEIVATYTPSSGGNPVSARVVVRVAMFSLRAEGACRLHGANRTTFVAVQNPSQVVTVVAEIDPAPFCVPTTLANWVNGNPTSDPLRRTVSKSTAESTSISVTVAGSTLTATIMVVTFTLRVEGAFQVGGPRSTTFATAKAAGEKVTVTAELNPAPSPVPPDLVNWVGGTPTSDPLRRTISRSTITKTTVRATVCRTTRSVTISVLAQTMILLPSLGFPCLVEPEGEAKVIFLAKDDLLTQTVTASRNTLQTCWLLPSWKDLQHAESVEVIEGPNRIEDTKIQKLTEGWVLIDHHLKLNSHLMTLYEKSGFKYIMWAKIKAPTESGMFRLINRCDEGIVLHKAIKGIHELEAFENDFPDDMPLIPDRGTTTVTTTEGKPSNMPVELYHPIYVTEKAYLDIAHVTDTHVALRWELYDRRAKPSDRYNNYNRRFEEIMSQSRGNADIILITGDIVDYNRGHSHPWDDANDLDSDYQFNRNWLLAYELILNCYAQNNSKPIFTCLGNHDWNLNAYAPIPKFLGIFELYKSSHDFNLLESDIKRIDPGNAYESDVTGKDKFTHETPASILWYSLVINPFLDFAFSYKKMTFLCLDWGHGTRFYPPQGEAAYSIDPGILPHPTKSISDSQWSLIREWYRTYQARKVKVIALHASVYQPYPEIGFEDLSQGRIHDQLIIDDPPPQYHPTRVHYSRYTHGELIWGAILNAHHRKDLINFLRSNLINLVFSGHSHRNTIFQIRRHGQEERVCMYRPDDLTDLDLTKSLFVSTTSAGPLGFKNDKGVAEHLGGLQERRKIHPEYRIIRFSNSGKIISLNTAKTEAPKKIREEVQQEFQES